MAESEHQPGLTGEQIAQRAAAARAVWDKNPADHVVQFTSNLFRLQQTDVEDEFIFPAFPVATRPRIFGGQVIAQALAAATLTVDVSKPAHSLHAYFLRGGDEGKPLHFRVHRDFDGRSFSNRRVVVRQDGKVIFNLTASFQAPEKGMEFQSPMPEVLPPEECLDFIEHLAMDPNISEEEMIRSARRRPFDMRTHRPLSTETGQASHYQWYRVAAPIADDRDLHRNMLAFVSDMGLLTSSLLPHGLTWSTPGLMSTSLDHAMWFHDDVHLDEWVVFVMDSDWTGGGRGINRGRVFTREGKLVASVVQEGLVRVGKPKSG
jgi:acyl-CoA thioesterase-2